MGCGPQMRRPQLSAETLAVPRLRPQIFRWVLQATDVTDSPPKHRWAEGRQRPGRPLPPFLRMSNARRNRRSPAIGTSESLRTHPKACQRQFNGAHIVFNMEYNWMDGGSAMPERVVFFSSFFFLRKVQPPSLRVALGAQAQILAEMQPPCWIQGPVISF